MGSGLQHKASTAPVHAFLNYLLRLQFRQIDVSISVIAKLCVAARFSWFVADIYFVRFTGIWAVFAPNGDISLRVIRGRGNLGSESRLHSSTAFLDRFSFAVPRFALSGI
jgi:hypothetical protein